MKWTNQFRITRYRAKGDDNVRFGVEQLRKGNWWHKEKWILRDWHYNRETCRADIAKRKAAFTESDTLYEVLEVIV